MQKLGATLILGDRSTRLRKLPLIKWFNWIALYVSLLAVNHHAMADTRALLLFDGETGREFAGCLNCSRSERASICNRFGDFGSRYGDTSIWSRFGDFGSRYGENSPWSRFGEGLRVVDQDGNYYGRFSRSTHGQSKLPLVRSLLEAWDHFDGDRMDIRKWFCS